MDDPQLDPTGKVVVELRDDPDVDAIVSGRVRGFEPQGATAQYDGDAHGPGKYKAFVVVTGSPIGGRLPGMRMVPVQPARLTVRCYGRTPQEAAALYGACVKAIHGRGPRTYSGVAFHQSFDETGGTPDKDPDTGQPLVVFVMEVLASTQVVA